MRSYRRAFFAAALVALVAFVGTNSALTLAVLVLLAGMVAADALFGAALARAARLSFDVRPSCRVGQPLAFRIEAERPAWLPGSRLSCLVACENVMLERASSTQVQLDAGGKASLAFELPLETGACGRVRLTVREARATGPLGLGRFRMAGSFAGSYTVYPKLLDLTVPLERAPHAWFSGSSYDPHRRGQDMSETFDVRDYREADPPHAIHWKLSSKLDKLVVREASHPSNYDVLILLDLGVAQSDGAATPVDVLAAALDLAASISYDLCRQSLGHNVACVSGGRMVDCMVDSPASFDAMLDTIVSLPLPPAPGECAALFDEYCRERSFTKTVLVSAEESRRVCETMSRLTDLSVVYVKPDGVETAEEVGGYAIVGIPVDAVEGQVRSVAI